MLDFKMFTDLTMTCADLRVLGLKPDDYKAGNRDIVDLWDFGPDPSKHVSYSYHIPYGSYALTASDEPGMAVAADRNPWLASSGTWRSKKDFQVFDPNGPREISKRGNDGGRSPEIVGIVAPVTRLDSSA